MTLQGPVDRPTTLASIPATPLGRAGPWADRRVRAGRRPCARQGEVRAEEARQEQDARRVG